MSLKNRRLRILGFSLSLADFSITAYNRSLRFTKEGGYFLILVFALGLTAINTGINLIYLLFAMCLSFIIVSGILSEYTLRGIVCERDLPAEAYPGDYFPVTVALVNKKIRWPSFSLWLEHGVEGISGSHKFYSRKIMPGVKEQKTGMWRLEKRGKARFGKIKLSTGFPFGFFVKSTQLDETREMVIYPRISPVSLSLRDSRGGGETPMSQKGGGGELHGFREFVSGDDHKRIHWKTSAKVNKLMLMESEAVLERKVTVVFDNTLPHDKKSDSAPPESFEKAVGLTASIINHLAENGHEILLVTNDGKMESDGSPESLQKIYRFLALIDPSHATIPNVSFLKSRRESGNVIVVEASRTWPR